MKLNLLLKILFINIMLLTFLCNCTKLSSGYIQRAYKKEELDKLLHIGMSAYDVVKKFGEPSAGKNSNSYLYTINPSKTKNKPGEFYINGFFVNFDNNKKVIGWDILMARDIFYNRKSANPGKESSKKAQMQ